MLEKSISKKIKYKHTTSYDNCLLSSNEKIIDTDRIIDKETLQNRTNTKTTTVKEGDNRVRNNLKKHR